MFLLPLRLKPSRTWLDFPISFWILKNWTKNMKGWVHFYSLFQQEYSLPSFTILCSLSLFPDTHTRIWSRESVESNGIQAKWKKGFWNIYPKYPVHSSLDEMCLKRSSICKREKSVYIFLLETSSPSLWEMEINCQWDSERKITWTGVSYVYSRYNLKRYDS